MVKTEEELRKEREEAQLQLEAILKTTRPKNLQEGVTSGVSNIVGGAVGAAGVAVLAPTIGLAQGLRAGGLLGGVIGVAGGAVIGVVGAAGLAIGGALSGVTQVVRGVAAVPQQIIAPRQGKWWNETEGKWVLTNMEEEKQNLPESDDDILGKLEEEIDASVELGSSPTGEVADNFYYECLEIPSNADQAAIKRKYYLLARKYHPGMSGQRSGRIVEHIVVNADMNGAHLFFLFLKTKIRVISRRQKNSKILPKPIKCSVIHSCVPNMIRMDGMDCRQTRRLPLMGMHPRSIRRSCLHSCSDRISFKTMWADSRRPHRPRLETRPRFPRPMQKNYKNDASRDWL